MSEPTRRDLLKRAAVLGTAAATGGALAAPAWARPTVQAEPEQTTTRAEQYGVLDVAVIGAGVSGAYAAWRLLGPEAERSPLLRELQRRRSGRLAVGLFEGSERVGGRLFSKTPPGMPHLHAELGGMRYVSTQPVVPDLVNHLRLPTAPFPVDEPQNLVYLRQRRFTQAQWGNPKVVPYRLPTEIRGQSPDDALLSVIERFVPGAGSMDHRAWDKIKPTASVEGRRLYDIGFWNLLLDAVGQEGWSFLRDGLGYGSVVDNVNSIEAMEASVADFVGSPPPQYLLLRDGYQTMPEELVRRFKAEGGKVHLHHQVRRISRETVDGEQVLTLALSVWPQGRPVKIRARHVILAMPQRSIELLDPDTFLFASDQFLKDLGSIIPRPASKLFLGYDRPWWEEIGLQAGRSVTDLPLRQTYYWGVEGRQPGADPANRNALLLASYNDLSDVEFWNELLNRPNRLIPVAVTRPPRPMDAAAPGNLVEEAQRQLRELHGPDARIPDPTVAYFQDWVQDPYGAAYHFWQVEAKSWEVMPRMRHPIADANLYVCGSAWSTGQGWVYGALTQAELMLEEHFGLPRPTWLPSGVYLGP
ncbi:flavin monoamine oxidase family protein [Catellatospora chokoriensis]|uniref:Amine oxidase n=1 Tax=Catellatospora chokoriensis TaxID=310353 RepID=A0A8J3JSF6_9ACTN|nr:NAD(P)/FAD-dependent oxidoreductase [Catellatospora chokoriensis]GIF87689.1 amine oxidase [Catellatospora chokoriensis]